MKKKATLTTQSYHWWITIRKNQKIPKAQLIEFCNSLTQGDMYAFIEHEKDVSIETGEVEGVHYHIVLNSAKRHQKAKILNDIVRFFDFDNPFGIEVDVYSSFEGCLQYLTHQNVKEKTQHKRDEIVHNIDKDLFVTFLDTPLTTELTASTLVGLIEQCDSPIDLAKRIGLGSYTHYYHVIRQWWRLIKGTDI